MRLEQLQYLLEIKEARSISAAAAKLYVSPSTMSEAIKKLEDELGVELFERSKTGMTLTPVGRQIAAECDGIEGHVRLIQHLASANARKTSNLSGELKLSICLGSGRSVFLQTLSTFQKIYPRVALGVMEKSTTKILDDLYHERCDVACLYCHDNRLFSQVQASYVNDELLTDCFCALVNERHALATRRLTTFRDLLRYPVAIYGLDDMMVENRSVLGKEFTQLNKEANIVFRSSDPYLFSNYLMDTGSVGLVLSNVRSSLANDDRLVAVPISDSMDVSLRYFYSGSSPKLELIDELVRVMKVNISGCNECY